ncbi:probable inactive lipase Rv1592c/MT1628, partial [Aspergillus udagawae]
TGPSRFVALKKGKTLDSNDIAKCQYQDINLYFTQTNMLDEPEAARMPDANEMGQHVPEIVLFVYKSESLIQPGHQYDPDPVGLLVGTSWNGCKMIYGYHAIYLPVKEQ